jgi:hypothetical protein
VAEFESLSEVIRALKGWSETLPGRWSNVAADRSVAFGERHGSWFLQVAWSQDEVSRSAELALTNAGVTQDAVATAAYISVRASASTDSRFVVETLYEQRRAPTSVSREELAGLLESAITRALNYNSASLNEVYATGDRPSSLT